MVTHLFNMSATVIKAPPESEYGAPPVEPSRYAVKCRANSVEISEASTPQGLRSVIRRRFYFDPRAPIAVTDRIAADTEMYRVEAVSTMRDIANNALFLQVDTVGVPL